MCQAKLNDILAIDYIPPDEFEDEYDTYKMKDDFLKNHLLTATLESNASSFINVKTMTGLEMYYKLLNVFQGQEYEDDKAVNAASEFERLRFNRNSRYSPETFLAKVNESLKRMEVEDGAGGTAKPVSNALLPSIFRAKIDHPIFETWKTLSEKTKESWDDIQISFLRIAEQKFRGQHDTSTKFRSANQRSGDGNNNNNSQKLSKRDNKAFEKACSDGFGVQPNLWKKLRKEEKNKVKKARDEKKKNEEKGNDGGIGSQYNLHQQLYRLPKGTILVPVNPQDNTTTQTNNTTATPTTVPTSNPFDASTTNKNNKIRDANFLQLANGNFVIRQTTFQISPKVRKTLGSVFPIAFQLQGNTVDRQWDEC